MYNREAIETGMGYVVLGMSVVAMLVAMLGCLVLGYLALMLL